MSWFGTTGTAGTAVPGLSWAGAARGRSAVESASGSGAYRVHASCEVGAAVALGLPDRVTEPDGVGADVVLAQQRAEFIAVSPPWP